MRQPTSGFIWALMLAFAFALLTSPTMAQAGDLEDGVAAFNAKNYEKALPLLESAAGAGVAEAEGLLGTMYELGHGVPQDREEAARWYLVAADQAYDPAMQKLEIPAIKPAAEKVKAAKAASSG